MYIIHKKYKYHNNFQLTTLSMNLTNKQFNVSVNFLNMKADHIKYKKYIYMKING